MAIIIFLLGLMIGSFLNCVIFRLEKEESFLKGRSYCPHCHHQLGFWDLIPVLSFFWLRGHCRYCRKSISWQYPIVEISTALIFLAIFNFQLSIFNYLIAPFLIVIFVYDLKHYLIPDQVIWPAIGIAVLYQLFRIWNFGDWDLFGIWDLGFGILPSLLFLAIIVLSRGRAMGLGDFKLAILMGLVLGWPNVLVALFLAFVVGAIMGVGLIIIHKKSLKSEVPFGPFLVAGTLVAMFYGQELINWYLSLL